MKWLITLILVLMISTPLLADTDFAKGVDLSILKEAEDHGVVYLDEGRAGDAIAIFKKHGCNWVRLRLFVNPSGKDGQVNSLSYTLALARRAHAEGMKVYLDFHYSDGWADVGQQHPPAAWNDLSAEPLARKVYDYTRETLHAFTAARGYPEMVSIGN